MEAAFVFQKAIFQNLLSIAKRQASKRKKVLEEVKI
jgi:hypothetical protein